MKDPIEREDAIEVVSLSCRTCLARNAEDCEKCSVPKLRELINAISSADRPRGEWTGGEIPNKCSVCGHNWDEYVSGQEIWYEGSVPNFCPNRGARMKRSE